MISHAPPGVLTEFGAVRSGERAAAEVMMAEAAAVG